MWRSSPPSRRCISNFSARSTKIADAKAEIFFGLERDGAAVVNRDIAQFAQLKRRAKEAGVARVVSFGEHAKADARLLKCALHPDCSTVRPIFSATR